jgi:hypothetical protein
VSPYFDYFGDRAGSRGAGFYRYTLGNWHIISPQQRGRRLAGTGTVRPLRYNQ